MKKRKYFKNIFLSVVLLLTVSVITACEHPFFQKEPTYEILSDGEYDGPGVRLVYGTGTVTAIDLVRSLLVIQPDSELPGMDTVPAQITLECEYLDLSAVVTGDHVTFYYSKENLSSDRIKIETLLNSGQETPPQAVAP